MNEKAKTTMEDGPRRRTSAVQWGVVVFLIVGLLVVDAAALVAYHREPLHEMVFVPLALGVSQIALLAIWSALGGTPAPVRLFGLVLGVVLWARLLCDLHRPDPPELSRTTVLLLAEAIFVSLPLVHLRLKGLQIVSVFEEPRLSTASSRQFSLGYLMAWMTSVAAVLGLIRFCVDPAKLPRDYYPWGALAITGVLELMLAGSCLYAALGKHFSVPPILPLVCVCVLIVCCCSSFELGMAFGHPWGVAAVGLSQVPLLLGPLYILRGAGFRLGREKRG